MAKINIITENELAFIVVATTLNKFDFYTIIDGERGLGKSTVGFKLSKNVSRIYRKLYNGDMEAIMRVFKLLKKENKNYELSELVERLIHLKKIKAFQFNPKEDLIYDQESAKIALDKWNGIAMFDEFINIGYSRDFFDRSQKDLIKLMNLNRDHTNLTIACIPHFMTTDVQLRNLCKLRIYVHKRGQAVILTPNRGLSIRDRWDTDINQKIENKWRQNGVKNPKWAMLTTFRAMMRTHRMTKFEERLYQEIKNEKRNNLIIKQEAKESPLVRGYKNIYNDLISYKFTSFKEINAASIALGITPATLRSNLRKMLKENNKFDKIKEFFYTEEKQKELKDQIRSQKTALDYHGFSDDEIIALRRARRKKELEESLAN